MANSHRDDNRNTTLLGIDSVDGVTPRELEVDEATGRLLVTSTVTGVNASTATVTSVASSASSVTLLSANTSRLGVTVTNDSTAVVYIKLGTTASTSSYTVSLGGSGSAPFEYFEVPYGYTGRIDAIWASANGNARITELS